MIDTEVISKKDYFIQNSIYKRGNEMQPQVSIICNTFNHAKYIEEAINGFLIQKTTFPIEILIHDDASSDGTADIIRKYASKYSELIKPVFQEENQYSKGISITMRYQIPRAQGKYLAFCEGDDYWTDPEKLQKQYDYMERHEEVSICCHAYSMVDRNGKLIKERHDFEHDSIVPIRRLIGNQLLIPHFATMLVRKSSLEGLDEYFLGERCKDLIYRLYCVTNGIIWYMNQNMSCYRRFVEGSWTERKLNQDTVGQVAGITNRIAFLMKYDEFTNNQYSVDIQDRIEELSFFKDLAMGNYRSAIKNKYFRKASGRQKLYIMTGVFFPDFVTKIRRNNHS